MNGRRTRKPKRTKRIEVPVVRSGKTLTAALAPFADVEIPSGKDGECVWFYVGKPLDTNHGHLQLEDFRRARRALGR